MRKNFTKAVAAILSVCVTMTSVSWENFIVAKSAEAEEMTEPENVTAENEIEEERTEDSTIFDLGGNRKMEVFHGADVRFRDESGELVDYDPVLVEICSEESAGGLSLAGYAYENREGDSKQYLPEALSENTPVLMEKGDYRISFHPVAIPEAGIQPEENGESPVESSGNLEAAGRGQYGGTCGSAGRIRAGRIRAGRRRGGSFRGAGYGNGGRSTAGGWGCRGR